MKNNVNSMNIKSVYRKFYDLARIWRDGKDVAVEEL